MNKHCDHVYSIDGKIKCMSQATHGVLLRSGFEIVLCKLHAKTTVLGKPYKLKNNDTK